MIAEGLPVWPVGSIVGLTVGLLEQSVAAGIEIGDGDLPFPIDLFRRLDSMGGRHGIDRLSLGREGRRRVSDVLSRAQAGQSAEG